MKKTIIILAAAAGVVLSSSAFPHGHVGTENSDTIPIVRDDKTKLECAQMGETAYRMTYLINRGLQTMDEMMVYAIIWNRPFYHWPTANRYIEEYYHQLNGDPETIGESAYTECMYQGGLKYTF